MKRIFYIVAIISALLLAGCAAKTEPQPEAPEEAQAKPAAKPMAKAPAMSSSRTAPAKVPEKKYAVAMGFTSCIDGFTGMGPVKIGMTAKEVLRAMPELEINRLRSSILSKKYLSLCNEGIRDYKVYFDNNCRARAIRFTGPARMERSFENICESHSTVLQEDNPNSSIKWRCEFEDRQMTVIDFAGTSNIYSVFSDTDPTDEGRCLLPKELE